jgi:hypothetical protein
MAQEVFICHVQADRGVAEAVAAGLEAAGIHCRTGSSLDIPSRTGRVEITDVFSSTGVLVLVLSAAANESPQFVREVEAAFAIRYLIVVPLRVEEVALNKTLEPIIGHLHWVDAITPPIEAHFDRLVAKVREALSEVAALARDRTVILVAPRVDAAAGSPKVGATPSPREERAWDLSRGSPPTASRPRGVLRRVVEGLRQLGRRIGRRRQPSSPLPPSPLPKPTTPAGDRSSTEVSDDRPTVLAAPASLERERAGTVEMPVGITDLVHFSVTAPTVVSPGANFLIDVWAHLEVHREEVLRRARRVARSEDILFRDKGPVPIARGSILTARLHPMDGFVIEDEADTIFWDGEIGNASFPVSVAGQAAPGPRRGTVSFFVASLAVAKLHFVLHVGGSSTKPGELPAEIKHYRDAFASYASEDRDEVLRIVQGLQKGVPDLKIFLDVTELRSGQRWEEELRKVIPTRDVFYLFWSRAAGRSPWVEKEWRCALESRGLDFIDPAPLEPPNLAPPPPELRQLHFNDWVLAYLRRGLPAGG